MIIATVRNIGRLDGTIVSWRSGRAVRRSGRAATCSVITRLHASAPMRLILVCDLRSVQGLLNISSAGIEVRRGAREAGRSWRPVRAKSSSPGRWSSPDRLGLVS